MKLLILDNYDSFTYNLYQYAGEILESSEEAFRLDVIRNDEIGVEEIRERHYDRIIISPGPGDPADKNYFGVCADVLLKLGKAIPVFGVCLGMQGIAHYFGGKIIRAEFPMHGKTSKIKHDDKGVFSGLPQDLEVMRYHSLIVDPTMIPSCLEISARVIGESKNEIMGLRHKEFPIEGIQFHPESFATEGGMKMIENFIFQK
ncbi:MAG: aminodeoxychorismate/anthranilate synthase component II [Leptospiraceae bacterium]|nr:aminodeoxychorismate/anthranilate synthase component II [Leptospiraceae bacterium]